MFRSICSNGFILALLGLFLFLPGGCPNADLGDPNDPQSQDNNPSQHNESNIPAVDKNDPQLKLLTQAETIVEKNHSDAVLVEVHGTPAGSKAQTAADIVNWEFRFMEDSDEPGAATVYLEYHDGEFDDPYTIGYGLNGTMYQRLPRTMTLTTAVQYLRDAGYKDGFSEVVLRKPLEFPVPDEASFAFKIGSKYVLVGMKTGKVTGE